MKINGYRQLLPTNILQIIFFRVQQKEIQTGLEQLFIISGWTYAFKLLFAVAPAQLQPLYSYLKHLCLFLRAK